MKEIYETQTRSLGQEDPLEEDMATHSNIVAWEIPWTEEPLEEQKLYGQSPQGRVEHN